VSVERRLVAIARFNDAVSAETLVALLAAHGVDAHVEGVDPLSIGLGGRVRVVIGEEELPRARAALDASPLSDGQAWFLATGELDPAAARALSVRSGAARRFGALRWAGLAFAIALAAAALVRVQRSIAGP
jgi:hypothetical protein